RQQQRLVQIAHPEALAHVSSLTEKGHSAKHFLPEMVYSPQAIFSLRQTPSREHGIALRHRHSYAVERNLSRALPARVAMYADSGRGRTLLPSGPPTRSNQRKQAGFRHSVSSRTISQLRRSSDPSSRLLSISWSTALQSAMPLVVFEPWETTLRCLGVGVGGIGGNSIGGTGVTGGVGGTVSGGGCGGRTTISSVARTCKFGNTAASEITYSSAHRASCSFSIRPRAAAARGSSAIWRRPSNISRFRLWSAPSMLDACFRLLPMAFSEVAVAIV